MESKKQECEKCSGQGSIEIGVIAEATCNKCNGHGELETNEAVKCENCLLDKDVETSFLDTAGYWICKECCDLMKGL